MEDGRWRFPVGAGITVESDAESEWKEIFDKAGDFQAFFSE